MNGFDHSDSTELSAADRERVRELLRLALGEEPSKIMWQNARPISESTFKAYRASLLDFIAWTRTEHPFPMPDTTIIDYLHDRSRHYAVKTLDVRLYAINYIHQLIIDSRPASHLAIQGFMRNLYRLGAIEKSENGRQEQAFTLEQYHAMLACTGDDLIGLRDRALLLLGVYGAFRQSELAALTCERIKPFQYGLLISIPPYKRQRENQTNHRYYKVIPFGKAGTCCPVDALHRWLEASCIKTGPVFRNIRKNGTINDSALSHTALRKILQTRAMAARLPDIHRIHAGSMRNTFILALVEKGVDQLMILYQARDRRIRDRRQSQASLGELARIIRDNLVFEEPCPAQEPSCQAPE